MTKQSNDNEQLPILVLWDAIIKHKAIAITIVVVIIAAIGGYYGYKHYEEKKEAEALIEHSLKHLADITGTYSNSRIKLELNADNTAILTTNVGSYNEARHLGHWEEKTEDYPITIEFSDSFEASMCGKYDEYFSILYFFANTLWPSLDAIQSRDYSSGEYLSKKK